MSFMYEAWCGDTVLGYGDYLHEERRELEDHVWRCQRLHEVSRLGGVFISWDEGVDELGRSMWHAMCVQRADEPRFNHRIIKIPVDSEDEVPREQDVGWDTVLHDIEVERQRQRDTWGTCSYPDGTGRPWDTERAEVAREVCQSNGPVGEHNWRDIVQEEVSEAFAETEPKRLREELVQVAAVVTHWIEAIDRRHDRKESM